MLAPVGEETREGLIHDHMPLARRLAHKYRNSTESMEDLEQAAYLALVRCANRYDPESGPFVAYAVPSILGELKRYFRDFGWSMRVPRSAKENHLRIREETERFASEHGRAPSVNELVELSGLEFEQVVEALEAAHAYSPEALDAPASASEDSSTIAERLGQEDPGFELVELAASVAPAFNRLPRRERQILKLRFVEDLTQREIAQRVGCSQMHVSRLLRAALEKLREEASVEHQPTVRLLAAVA
jgi:RNA polymerase sigma-B factor